MAGGFLIDLDGAGSNFDASMDQSFTLVDADAVTGFDPSAFTLDTSGFAPDLMGGTFAVGVSGGDLVLNFTAIPEPASALVGVAGLGLMAMRRRR